MNKFLIKTGKRLRRAAALTLTFALALSSASPVFAATVIKKAKAVQNPDANGKSYMANSRNSATASGVLGTAVIPDTEAPAPQGAGYTREQALAAAERLYSFEKDPVRKEIEIQYLFNSIWYEPDNLMRDENGKYVLRACVTTIDRYETAYLTALDGLEFFSSPTVFFLKAGEQDVWVGIERDERFSEAEAAANYKTLMTFLGMIDEVKAKASGDDADKAKFICDYVADRLTYDRTYEKNCLAEAVRTGRTACVGYNTMTELLFEHCGIPYISVVADEDKTNMQHIFGIAKIASSWLVFDTTNYDQDDAKEVFWLFSDQYRQGTYYSNFKAAESPEE